MCCRVQSCDGALAALAMLRYVCGILVAAVLNRLVDGSACVVVTTFSATEVAGTIRVG